MLLLLVSGCVSTTATPDADINPVITPEATASDEWQTVAPGLESRFYTPPNRPLAQMMVLRIDPALYTFRAHYRPGEALYVHEWQAELPGATVLVNANFFNAAHEIQGLLVMDGVAYGASYTDRGGMLQLQNGVMRVRSLLEEPYRGEALEQAVQAFPMLLLNGGLADFRPRLDRPTRRTVVGQDRRGRILLLVTPLLGLSLVDLQNYLIETDLELVNVLNLDGGGSTMMALAAGSSSFLLRSFDPVPAVLAIYAR